jgi:sodium/potassium/calcium exchanger 6
MLKSRSVALDPKRHAFQTKFGVGVTVATLVLFGGLSLLYGVPEDASLATSSQRMLEEDDGTTDYRSYSCNDLFQTVPQAGAAQCAFATTCNQGYGLWAHFVFCSTWLSRNVLIMCISPFVVLWLVLLFRMLGSTAEDYFSPALEMFAVKLRLPPRFAGVTLLGTFVFACLLRYFSISPTRTDIFLPLA